jgi:hypothetical protein
MKNYTWMCPDENIAHSATSVRYLIAARIFISGTGRAAARLPTAAVVGVKHIADIRQDLIGHGIIRKNSRLLTDPNEAQWPAWT